MVTYLKKKDLPLCPIERKQTGEASLPSFVAPATKKVQLLTLIRNTKPYDFEKKSDGWEAVLVKAQNKGIYPVNKSWLDFYYEIWISHLDDTIVSILAASQNNSRCFFLSSLLLLLL